MKIYRLKGIFPGKKDPKLDSIFYYKLDPDPTKTPGSGSASKL